VRNRHVEEKKAPPSAPEAPKPPAPQEKQVPQ